MENVEPNQVPDGAQLIDSSPMGLRHWSIIIVALYLNALDGYDMVAMAFGAGQVAEAFTLSDVTTKRLTLLA